MGPIEALYVHIPFCHSICPFCAFAVHGDKPRLHDPYLAALTREAELYAEESGVRGAPLRSVYVGVGTPSALAAEEAGELLARLRELHPFADGAEVAWEVNPEDATPDYLAALSAAGVNRISVGLQSLDDPTLSALGRNHDAAQGRAAVAALAEAGMENFNLDLLFGAPGIGPEAFRRDVEAVLKCAPPHLSLYALDIEERTLFGRKRAVVDWAAAHREDQAAAYLWAAEALRAAGYRHYEVSNFCRPGREGLQNRLVWDGAGYLGLGAGAHSYVGGVRRHNERHIRPYQRALAEGRLPVAQRETLTTAQRANEALMLALRRDSGLDLAAWSARFGAPWDQRRAAIAERLASEGRATMRGGRLTLTPRGFAVADEITAALMLDR